MHQATQRSSLHDVITIACLTTMLEVERIARTRDGRQLHNVADQLRHMANRSTAFQDQRHTSGSVVKR